MMAGFSKSRLCYYQRETQIASPRNLEQNGYDGVETSGNSYNRPRADYGAIFHGEYYSERSLPGPLPASPAEAGSVWLQASRAESASFRTRKQEGAMGSVHGLVRSGSAIRRGVLLRGIRPRRTSTTIRQHQYRTCLEKFNF